MTWRVLRGLVTLGLMGAVLWIVAPQDVVRALASFDPVWFSLAVLALTSQTVLSAWRWRLTAQGLGLELRAFWCVREYGLSVASNTFLPGGVVGDLARVVRTRHHGWQMATASVVIERLAGQIALALVALVGLVLWQGPWAGLAAVLVLACVSVAIFRFAPTIVTLLMRSWGAAGVWQRQIMLSLAILSLNIFGFWAAARATGVTLGAEAAIALIPLTLLAMLAPITINGWGVREAVAAALWPLWAIPAAEAVAATVVFGLACMGAALLGLLPMLRAETASGPAAPDGTS